eukprot:15327782-Ditylum_brightwellii.AAC.1
MRLRIALVLLAVSSKLVLEAVVCFANMVESGVRGPQSGKHLAHRTEVLFHSSFANWLVICSHDVTTDMFCKKLKEGDEIRDVVQRRGDLEPLAEIAPLGPVCAIGSCAGAGGSNTRMLSVSSIGAVSQVVVGAGKEEGGGCEGCCTKEAGTPEEQGSSQQMQLVQAGGKGMVYTWQCPAVLRKAPPKPMPDVSWMPIQVGGDRMSLQMMCEGDARRFGVKRR